MPGIAGMPGMSGGPLSPTSVVTITNSQSGTWSDPATWSGKVPGENNMVTIASGTTVTYDMPKSPSYRGIMVDGNLLFSRTLSTSITFQNMTIDTNGYVEVGTTASPLSSSVHTTLYLDSAREGAAGIMVMYGGSLQIHGAPLAKTFTKLSAPAPQGSTQLLVADPVGWNVGDHVVITSTSLFAGETEENTIKGVAGNLITLMKPLNYSHDGISPAQGEVADLTRNVVVTSKNPAVHAMGVMFMNSAKGSLSYAEFSHLGGLGVLGRYPIHFHHVQKTMTGTVLDGLSVWDSHNRFITIHNTQGITVKNSVGFNSTGHGFFLEDATEENNTLTHNIAILTNPGTIRPDDGSPAGFWIQNPRNTFTDNIAVSAAGSGYEFAIPDSAPDVVPFDKANFLGSLNQKTTPSNHTITAFTRNEAHSNAGYGVFLYRLDPSDDYKVNVFSDLRLWRNNYMGIDLTTTPLLMTNLLLFGNQFGNMQLDTSDATIRNVKAMGELDGVKAAVANDTNAFMERYVISPIGLIFKAGNLTIQDSSFSGHIFKGKYAYGDLINGGGADSPTFNVTISHTMLLSKHTIIFGYPLDGNSFIKVISLNNDPAQSFTLYRYDLDGGPGCKLNTAYMALQCPK